MNRKNLTLISRIEQELKDLTSLLDRVQGAWSEFKKTSDPYYLDSVALNLHGFYSSLERIFINIARELDGSLPSGPSWHQELLRQMKMEIRMIRPAVISPATSLTLDDYRAFRHVVRNIYSLYLSEDRIQPLVEKLPDLVETLKKEILAFTEMVAYNSSP